MAKNQNDTQANESVENSGAFIDNLDQSGEFIQKYKNVLLGIAGALVLAVAGIVFYNYTITKQNNEAQEMMFSSVYYFEADSLAKALEGDERSPGLLHVAENFSRTEAGNLANFYVGVIYLKQGRFDEAITYLENFSSSDLLLQARAYSLIGDAHMEKGNFEEAVSKYKLAADYRPNEQFTPNYIMKAGLAYEMKSDFNSAVSMYDRIIQKYPGSQEFNDARKYRARAESLSSAK